MFSRLLQWSPVSYKPISVSTQCYAPYTFVLKLRKHTHTHTSQSCSGPVLVFVDLDWDGNPVVMLRINTAALDRPAERVLRNWISCLGLSSEVEYQSGHLKRKLLVEASGRCGSGRGSQDYRPELILWTSSQSVFVGFFWFLSLMWSRFCEALPVWGTSTETDQFKS